MSNRNTRMPFVALLRSAACMLVLAASGGGCASLEAAGATDTPKSSQRSEARASECRTVPALARFGEPLYGEAFALDACVSIGPRPSFSASP